MLLLFMLLIVILKLLLLIVFWYLVGWGSLSVIFMLILVSWLWMVCVVLV